ncbi:hypothetical protein NPIL_409511 [Nephila pilipes]|uniref:Uncharacterized protein n=1 Tax=Nephila pilipes TaxID=299642 RepID=A0A8X6UTY3_NEPPI|nr:hypothetical protein NPIL_409511 [Nephila pilipes]
MRWRLLRLANRYVASVRRGFASSSACLRQLLAQRPVEGKGVLPVSSRLAFWQRCRFALARRCCALRRAQRFVPCKRQAAAVQILFEQMWQCLLAYTQG